MKRLEDWLGERPGVKRIEHAGGAIAIQSREPSLWHLEDYIVSNLESEFVWLCPVRRAKLTPFRQTPSPNPLPGPLSS